MSEPILELTKRVGTIEGKLDELLVAVTRGFQQVDLGFEQVDQRFEQVDQRFEQVDQRFEQVDQRFEQVDKRFGQFDKRFGDMEKRFDGIDEAFAEQREYTDMAFATLGKKVDRLDMKVTRFMDKQVVINARWEQRAKKRPSSR